MVRIFIGFFVAVIMVTNVSAIEMPLVSIDGKNIKVGDKIIGLASTGLHTNGYSLARRALLEEWTVDSYLEETGSTVGDALLAIHRSYLTVTRDLIRKPWLHGGGHITGGGITGNLNDPIFIGES